MTFTFENTDSLIDQSIYGARLKNRINPNFAMTPKAREYLKDTIHNCIENGKDDASIAMCCVAFIAGYSNGLEDMSDFAMKLLNGEFKSDER